MPKVTIPPDLYKKFQGDFRRVKGMNLTGFINWVRGMLEFGYEEGWNACIDAFVDAHGKVDIDGRADAVLLDAEELRGILLSVRGIGHRRADEVIARITGEGHEEVQ